MFLSLSVIKIPVQSIQSSSFPEASGGLWLLGQRWKGQSDLFFHFYSSPFLSGSSSLDFRQAGGISAWQRGSGGEEASLILACFILLPCEACDPAEMTVATWKVRSCFGAMPNSAWSPLTQGPIQRGGGKVPLQSGP